MLAALAAAVWMTSPQQRETADLDVSDVEVMTIVDEHCVSCHAASPSHESFNTPPKEMVLETIDDLHRHAELVSKFTVQTRTMPLGNETEMMDEERAQLGAGSTTTDRVTGSRAADMLFSIDDLNRMSVSDFVARFGDVAEHSPWVVERAAGARPFADREAVVDAFAAALRGATRDERVAVLRAHPDRAGRAAVAGDLSEDSRREQAGAGLDRLTPAEFERFTVLNGAYRERFGIPFIFAVKGATKKMILAAFEERSANAPEVELENATDNVCRIMHFRIKDRVAG